MTGHRCALPPEAKENQSEPETQLFSDPGHQEGRERGAGEVLCCHSALSLKETPASWQGGYQSGQDGLAECRRPRKASGAAVVTRMCEMKSQTQDHCGRNRSRNKQRAPRAARKLPGRMGEGGAPQAREDSGRSRTMPGTVRKQHSATKRQELARAKTIQKRLLNKRLWNNHHLTAEE